VLCTGSTRPVSETKLAIAAELWRSGLPMTSGEVREALETLLPLAAVEYHLCTLVETKVAEVVIGPELHFQFVPSSGRPGVLQRAVPSALTESKRTEP
jgi:hypothetical protein